MGEASASAPALLLLAEHEPLLSVAERWASSFGEMFSLYLLDQPLPEASQVTQFVATLGAVTEERGLRRISLFGLGAASTIALEYSVRFHKSVRRLILLDACSRLRPTRFERYVDRLETLLPLGLPFRSLSKNFDARPILHQIRCPTLLLQSPEADSFVREQVQLMAQRIPNSWTCSLIDSPLQGELSDELHSHLEEFVKVPVKRPQKNV